MTEAIGAEKRDRGSERVSGDVIAGASMRKVKAVTEELCGHAFGLFGQRDGQDAGRLAAGVSRAPA